MALTQVQGQMLNGSNNTTTTIQSNGTTAITIDSSQNVGIGTGSPTGKTTINYNANSAYNTGLSVYNANSGSSAVTAFQLTNDAANRAGAYLTSSTCSFYGGTNTFNVGTVESIPFTFLTGNSERMRIDTSGNLLIGATDTNVGGGDTGFKFVDSASAPYCGQVIDVTPGYNTYHLFNKNATNNGYRFYVNVDGGIRNYSGNNTNLSDERTKDNIELADSYLDKICAIPVKTFNYKDEPRNFGKTLGVIAQDVEKIAPEFVNNDGWIENEPREDEPLKSVYTTDMMFGMMKAIQELNAKVEAQAAEIKALKGK